MNLLIPIYHCDGSICGWVDDQRLAALESAGLLSRVVRQRHGVITRAILHMRPGDPKPVAPSTLLGTRYAVRQHLSCGPAWDLKHLGGSQDSSTYAPPESRADFMRVVEGCTTRRTSASGGATPSE